VREKEKQGTFQQSILLEKSRRKERMRLLRQRKRFCLIRVNMQNVPPASLAVISVKNDR